MDIVIDPKTGLAQVPEGFRFKIRKSYFMSGAWIVVSLQKKVGPFWLSVMSEEGSHAGRAQSLSVDAAFTYFNKDKIKEKERREEAKSRAVYGTYPPRSLNDKDTK